MKQRIALLTVFFYCCTFTTPPQVRAAVPILIAAAAIGATMAATSAGTYYAQTGQAPQYVKTAADVAASAADAIFQPSYLAQAVGYLFTPQSLATAQEFYVGKAAAVGASIGDIVDHVTTGAAASYANLRALIESHTSSGQVPISSVPSGAIFTTSLGNFSKGDGPYDGGAVTASGWDDMLAAYPHIEGTNAILWHNTTKTIFYLMYRGDTPNASGYYTQWFYFAWKTTNNSTFVPPPSGVIYPDLYNDLLAPAPLVASELQEVIKDIDDDLKKFADAVPSTAIEALIEPTLTASEVSQVLRDNAAAVARAAAESAAQIAAANPDDASAQILANQAAAEAAKAAEEANRPDEETFSPISATPFQEAYNPGELDIPARFTTFLTNVKSSGLFSFSSDFFESIPGGGSPIYQINGGETFGTHTIDLSDTLSGGLAVLKTILLVCFGFLSIRAVIMKR